MVSKEKQMEYMKLAVDTVIQYAREQGVKLRHSDFPYRENRNFTGNLVEFRGLDIAEALVVVFINREGRWSAQLKKAQDNFLNYVNARVTNKGVLFSFAISELDLLCVKKEDSEAGTKNVDLEKVIDRIAKVLAKADPERNKGGELEAIQASLLAQKLLAKYNLTMADVTGERDPAEGIEQVIADVGTGNKWKYELSDVVASNYACKTFSRGSEMVIFYGYKADVLIARRVFVYLFKVGNRLATQYSKKYREEVGNASGVYNSFVSGFVEGVKKELDKQCTALALIVQPEVEEAWNIFSAIFRERDRSINTNGNFNNYAFNEGYVEGKRALNAQYLEDGKVQGVGA